MVQNVLVLDIPEVPDPAEEAIARRGRLSLLAQAIDVGARRIQPAEAAAEDEEQGDEDRGDDGGRHEGRQKGRQRVRFGLCVSVGAGLAVGL